MLAERLLEWGRAHVDAWARDVDRLEAARAFLIHGYVPVLQALLTVTLLCALASLPALWRAARRLSGAAWIGALTVTNLALALRIFWSPHLPQVYFDEIFFLNTADQMAHSGLNAMISLMDGAVGKQFHSCPAAWQFLVALLYRWTGPVPAVAFAAASLLSALTVLGLFLAVVEMSGSVRAGLASALLLAVLPVHLRLAGSAALETASLCFLAWLLFVLSAWFRERSAALLLLAACLAAWFVNIRMENSFALLPLVLGFFTVFCPSEALRGLKSRSVLLAAAALVVAFAFPALLADGYGLATHFYFFYETPQRIQEHVRDNFAGNFRYWVDGRIQPLPFTVLALAGLVAAVGRGGRWRRLGAFWAAWWLALVVFYSANPSCDFALRHTLDSWRTALHPALGVLVLAGFGVDALAASLRDPRVRHAVGCGFVALCLTAVPAFGGFVHERHVWMSQWEALQSMRGQLPADAFLLLIDSVESKAVSGESLAYDVACATGVLPQRPLFTPDDPHQQLIRDVHEWSTVEKRKVFLYHLDSGSEEEARGFAALQRWLHLRTVAGSSVRRGRVTFSLYRVEEVAATAQMGARERPGVAPDAGGDDRL